MEDDFIDLVYGDIPPHDDVACAALREYDRLAEARDRQMFEQLPWNGGTVNGRRLNTPAIPLVQMIKIALKYGVTIEAMKKHWRCIERDEARQR